MRASRTLHTAHGSHEAPLYLALAEQLSAMPAYLSSTAPLVAVCALELGNPIVGLFLDGILEGARAAGIRVNLMKATQEEALTYTNPAQRPPLLSAPDLSALIFIHRWPPAVMSDLSAGRPSVSLVHEPAHSNIGLVTMDNASGVHLLMEHLHALGHRRIGYFGKNTELTWAKERYTAYMEYLDERELVHDVRCAIPLSTLALQTGQDRWDGALDQALTRSRSGYSAWICPAGRAAHRLRSHLLAHGLEVPRAVSVAVFDAIAAEDLDYTRLAIDHRHLGILALRQVAERIANPAIKASITVVPSTLHAGHTSARKA